MIIRLILLLHNPKLFFLFDGKVYDHVDGIAMRSPLAPTLENLLMGHQEKQLIEAFQEEKPITWISNSRRKKTKMLN